LQRNFREMNDELKRVAKTELPELLLMSRVMSTLPAEYFKFKRVWKSVPLTERIINKLTERLRLIEMRLSSKASGDLPAFVVKGGEKKVHVKKEKSEKPERKCFNCHQPEHIAKNCPNKKAIANSDVREKKKVQTHRE
jgi:hypothetical protein